MKRIKDPIYGYIDLPDELISGIIDTAEYQRLRRIVQTSYAPLFPSALHNRFVHSLGVYHLGVLAVRSLDRSMAPRLEEDESLKDYWKQARETFELACLLHDVGHAPFSHTGESLYDRGKGGIDDKLREIVSDDDFSRDSQEAKREADLAAPHEVMSALLGLRLFQDMVPIHDLFARCITGYRYSRPEKAAGRHIGNVLIGLLNSTIFDVDKLDYLIRDAYVTGFDSMHLDYNRLLQGIRVVGTKRPSLSFHKSAISVLENVVYARDLEKRWIQAHPTTLYEQYLVEHMARLVNERAAGDEVNLFVEDALTSGGVAYAGGQRARLLSDDDVLFFAKREFDVDEAVREYFERASRRHPLWKSEAEFRSLFCLDAARDKETSEVLCRAFRSLIAKLREQRMDPILTSETLDLVNRDIEDAADGATNSILVEWKTASSNDMAKVLKVLESFSADHGIEFSYVLLSQSSFRSALASEKLAKLDVVFSDEADVDRYRFGDVCPSVSAQETTDDVFYLFHHKAGSKDLPKGELVKSLKEAFQD